MPHPPQYNCSPTTVTMKWHKFQNVRAVHMHSYNILPGGPRSPAPHRHKRTQYIFTERTFCWHIMNGGPLWSAMPAATKERSAEGTVVGICTSPRWGYSRMQGKMRKLGPKPLYHRAIKSAFAFVWQKLNVAALKPPLRITELNQHCIAAMCRLEQRRIMPSFLIGDHDITRHAKCEHCWHQSSTP